MRKKSFLNYKITKDITALEISIFLSFLHSVKLLRKFTKGGDGGAQIKKSPSKKRQKHYHKLDIIVSSNIKVPKLNISYQRKKETGIILKKLLFDINL